MTTPKQDRKQGNQGGMGEHSDGRRGGSTKPDQMQQGGKKPGQADGKQTDQPQHGGAGQHSTR